MALGLKGSGFAGSSDTHGLKPVGYKWGQQVAWISL